MEWVRELKEAVGVRKRELRNNEKKTWNARLKERAVWLLKLPISACYSAQALCASTSAIYMCICIYI